MTEVYINKLSKFLPYEPVANDEMESVLGMVDGKPSKVRRLILRNNGIKKRYYGLGNGHPTLTNAELTAKAIQQLFPDGSPEGHMDLLACGTTSPDQTLPSHAAMVHGILATPPVEIASFSGACNTGMTAFKYAWLSVAAGDKVAAVATGSERFSQALQANKFQTEVDKAKEIEKDGYIAFEKDFLRWMLSDGAGAALFSNKPNVEGPSLKVEWVEMTSFAGQIETCMYSGGVKEGSRLIGYHDMTPTEWLEQSVFALKQDTRLLGENIVARGADFLEEVIEKRGIDPTTIDWFLPHLSSDFFRLKIQEELRQRNIHIPLEAWFTNLYTVGNVGAASPYLMLEELMNEGKFTKGQSILMMIPESARFSYNYTLLTVV